MLDLASETVEYAHQMEKFRDIHLNCEPANFEAAKAAMIDIYKLSGATPPKSFIYVPSIYKGSYIAAIIDNRTKWKAPQRDEIIKRIKAGETFYYNLDLTPEIKNNIYLRGMARNILYDAYYGQHENLSSYNLSSIGGDQIKLMIQFAKNAGWAWCFEEVCIITDRPAEIHVDNFFRLHNENGPAVKMRCGFEMYVINGKTMSRSDHAVFAPRP